MDVTFICVVIDCGGLTDPEGGQVTITSGIVATTGLNATAAYTCDAEYVIVGDTTRTCEANGKWNGAEPMCTRKFLKI